jgi:hypothetical protein
MNNIENTTVTTQKVRAPTYQTTGEGKDKLIGNLLKVWSSNPHL